MNGTDLQSNMYWLLMQVAVRAKHDFARIAEQEYGLTWVQLHTLCLLDPDNPVPMNVISCQLACDASNVTGIVDRLSANDLAARQDDPHDRRLKLIALTKRGAHMRQAVIRDLRRLAPGGFQNLSTEERAQLSRLLQKALARPADC